MNGIYNGIDNGTVNGLYQSINGGVGNGIQSNDVFFNKNKPISSGLVLYLDASLPNSYPQGGTTWIDLTNNSNGILINGPTFDLAIGNAPGILCNNSGIIVPHVPAHLNIVSSISIWFWTSVSFGSDRVWVIKGTSNGSYTHYLYEASSTLAQYFYTSLSSANNLSNSSVNNGRWNNIVLVYDGANFILYLNGIQNSTQSRITTGTVSTPLCINGDSNGTINSFIYLASTKKYNQVLMYNRALSPFEVLINYNISKTRFNL